MADRRCAHAYEKCAICDRADLKTARAEVARLREALEQVVASWDNDDPDRKRVRRRGVQSVRCAC